MSSTLTNEAHQRSLRDFLTLYNTITEYCFNKCVSNFNERNVAVNETHCIDVCTDTYVQYNQRFMFNFVDHQERRKKDLERLALEAAQKEAAAAQAAQPEQLTASQEQQLQKTADLLETISSGNSSNVKSDSIVNPSDGPNILQSSVFVQDTSVPAHHVQNVTS